MRVSENDAVAAGTSQCAPTSSDVSLQGTARDTAWGARESGMPASGAARRRLLVPGGRVRRLQARIAAYFRQGLAGIANLDFDELALDYTHTQRFEEQLSALAAAASAPLEARRVLEIGSGFGGFVALARQAGILAVGVEPDPAALSIARELQDTHGRLVQSCGERLPFASSSFDVVYSTQVLEHVANPAYVIREAARVLRPGGRMLMVVPNYRSFWEGHYCLLWPPLPSKTIARLWVRCFRRDPSYVDTLNFITPGVLRRILGGCPDLRVLDWGHGLWRRRLVSGVFPTWGGVARLKPLVDLVRRLGLACAVAQLGIWLECYTPICLVVEKVPEQSAEALPPFQQGTSP